MVKAILVHKHGGPNVLSFENIILPELGQGDVLIKNHAIGLNFLDTYFRSGLYPVPKMPFTVGSESAGEVVAVGVGVTRFKVGERVATVSNFGAYAEQRIVSETALVKLPESISYMQAAGILLKGLTAEYLLHRTYRVKQGDIILVHAAAGGTGQILVQWAKSLGAIVIGTVGSNEKADIALSLGIDHVINYSEGNFASKVREITQNKMCDVVYDGVGNATFAGSLDSLKPFGLLASFGSASGAVDPFSLSMLAAKGSLYVTRPTLATHISKPETLAGMAKRLFDAVATGIVSSDVGLTVKLEDAAEAHKALEARKTSGATILIP